MPLKPAQPATKQKRKCQFTDDHVKKFLCFIKGKRGIGTEGWCEICESSVSVAFEGMYSRGRSKQKVFIFI